MAFLDQSFSQITKKLDETFDNCADIKKLPLNLQYMDEANGKIYFVESAVNEITIREVVLGLSDVEEVLGFEDIVSAVLVGNAVLVIEGKSVAYKIQSRGYPGLGISPAEDEQVLRGSNEGFSDSYKTNSALIRKRIRSEQLKVEVTYAGVRSNTAVSILFMDGIARKEIIENVKKRLEDFKIDGIMDSGVIEQLTMDNEYSPFPQYMTTGRPDRAALALLNGHVVILVDNSPVALIFPVNFGTFVKAADDYYNRWEIVSFIRIIRYIAVFLALSLPSLYIAIMNYHPEVLPADIVNTLVEARNGIPFSVFTETIIMELAFELIREAGVRVPGPMGNTIGIVGGLIVGSAAVDASLASPIIVIVVALTALCSFTIPNDEFSSAFRLLKYYLLVLAGLFGIYGYLVGIMSIIIHLSGLKSYGFPYLGPMAAADVNENQDEKDFIIRMPYMYMNRRPIFSKRNNRRRLDIKRKK